MKSTGVIIARFQTPYLHEGHYEMIRYVKEKHNKVVIILGVSPVKGSTRNPLDFFTREKMVKKAFPDLLVLPMSDFKNDKTWSENIDRLLTVTFPMESFVLYGSRSSFIPYYSGKLKTEEIPQKGDFNASDLRMQISDKVMDSEDFRSGVIYAYYNTYPKTYTTVDIALFKDNYNFLLLGYRKSEGAWRLPGGFTDPEDESFESAALRELHEECGLVEVTPVKYEASFQVDDWRYRQERDKIVTLLYSCELVFGQPKGADDLDEVQWFSLEEVKSFIREGKLTMEHIPLINILFSKYDKVPAASL